MIAHDLIQGAPEWLAHRATGFNGEPFFNASDAPAMMGCSPYKTRAELLREMHTGLAAEVDAGTQRRFDDGHRFEALARPLAEQIVGQDLYPVTGSEGRYSASFDGLTLAEDVAFEHKTLNDSLRAAMRQQGGNANDFLAPHYRVQLEHQCMVSGSERVLFMASKWADDDTLIEERHCWYTPDTELRAEIIAGWAQFAADLAAYTPPPIAEPARAEPMESLPAVAVRLDGALTVAGNLPSFAVALRAFIDKLPKQPATDNDFATVDAGCKALKKAEEALDAAEAGALASITDVEAMRRAVADCRKLARDTRLAAEKMVERRKTEIKEQAVAAARRALDDHIAALNSELAPMRLPLVVADFAGSIKGLKSFASMQDRLDTTMANAKIAADGGARAMRANLAAFKTATGDDRALQALFADLGQLVHKAADDFAAVLDHRITKHRADEAAREAARQAAEAQRVAEAERHAAAEAEARLRAEQETQARREREAAEGDRLRIERESQAQAADILQKLPEAVKAGAIEPDRAERIGGLVASLAAGSVISVAKAAANEPATLTLGMICERLQFTVRADFLADVLHVSPAKVEGKRPGTYTESQFQTICSQLRSHISAMGELYAGEVA